MAASMSMNAPADRLVDHGAAMDRMYRLQRHVYDATRRYYLLGRDEMLKGLDAPPGASILEIGCGTGRNLVEAGRRFPEARLFGIDISNEMLKSAGSALVKHGIACRTTIAQADAARFDARRSLGHATFDRVFFSFALSMIPEWQAALLHAERLLAPDGELHVVDFGQCEGLHPMARKALFKWLSMFGVSPRRHLPAAMQEAAAGQRRVMHFASIYRGYSWMLKVTPPERAQEALAPSEAWPVSQP
jgi:S-adenosylmethionine-diacylgycerolhomoserine-N-methlytransferase